MDQQVSTPAPTVNETQEFLRDSLAKTTLRVTQLEEHIQKVTQRSYQDSADKNRMVESMQEWTLCELENQDITEEQAEAIAEIMGFELTKEFEVEVTVLYSVTVNARTEEDATNAIHDIDFDTVDYNSDSIAYLSSSIDRVDIQQGATNKPEHVYKLLTFNSLKIFLACRCDIYHICLRSHLKNVRIALCLAIRFDFCQPMGV